MNHQTQDAIDHAADQVMPLLDRTGRRISALAHDGVDAAQETAQQLGNSARRASRQTVGYIRAEPVKAVLLAAAAGAALIAVMALLTGAGTRHRDDH